MNHKAIENAAQDATHLPTAKPDLSDPATPLSAVGPAFDEQAQQIGPAGRAYERLIAYIRNFEHHLDADHEVAMGSAGSEAGILQIEGIGFFDPEMITFFGRDAFGMKMQLIQHVSQLSVMLRAVPKASTDEPARRIGFKLAAGWTGGDAGDASA